MTEKDPNIANEQGHTYYPKWVKNSKGERVVVENPKEEEQVTGKASKQDKSEKLDKGWSA